VEWEVSVRTSGWRGRKACILNERLELASYLEPFRSAASLSARILFVLSRDVYAARATEEGHHARAARRDVAWRRLNDCRSIRRGPQACSCFE